ncbi:hypothetical protein Acav_2017 [Paracidovorax avenae ATCC 19860]|uniref:Uncharacterized protein n=1 Tax=Paracidovorax avenae (strain ATCC 19860 / DSM 7227 / CCUG 15838 / JCM 20985 / LMG 2117 / NCPPB 1011) TaxID=643561 RepID=F0Q900_PARA1|nr:hypothetical protein [Paracidovorax avenae]ADX45931.1 hypothetical protein Acav_2017 [Paracidovorax avenae ATCC 19860]AVS67800.1 hypothetical protein C8245_20925 [Paracidovorax avenae]
MRYLLGWAGLAVGIVAWGIVLNLSASGLPYVGEGNALLAWLIYSPALLCLVPLACLKLQHDGVAAIWLFAIAPIAGLLNAAVAVFASTGDRGSLIVVGVLSILWACPVGRLAWGALVKRKVSGRQAEQWPD